MLLLNTLLFVVPVTIAAISVDVDYIALEESLRCHGIFLCSEDNMSYIQSMQEKRHIDAQAISGNAKLNTSVNTRLGRIHPVMTCSQCCIGIV